MTRGTKLMAQKLKRISPACHPQGGLSAGDRPTANVPLGAEVGAQ